MARGFGGAWGTGCNSAMGAAGGRAGSGTWDVKTDCRSGLAGTSEGSIDGAPAESRAWRAPGASKMVTADGEGCWAVGTGSTARAAGGSNEARKSSGTMGLGSSAGGIGGAACGFDQAMGGMGFGG